MLHKWSVKQNDMNCSPTFIINSSQMLVNGLLCFKSPLMRSAWGVTSNLANCLPTFASRKFRSVSRSGNPHSTDGTHHRLLSNTALDTATRDRQQTDLSEFSAHIRLLYLSYLHKSIDDLWQLDTDSGKTWLQTRKSWYVLFPPGAAEQTLNAGHDNTLSLKLDANLELQHGCVYFSKSLIQFYREWEGFILLKNHLKENDKTFLKILHSSCS